MKTHDAIIVGGGPAGSTCAAALIRGGVDTLLIDAATFPREKLCAGWVSPLFWDAIELLPREYPRGLWEWNKGYVHFAGRRHTVGIKGHFLRRYELDDFLLRRSRVPLIEGHLVRRVERDADGMWVLDGELRAKYLVGAGGSRCPVARAVFPPRPDDPCGTQEREIELSVEEIAAYREGEDGEPQLLLHEDLRGYSWNVPKSRWLNIGTGTAVAREVLPAWREARAFFERNGAKGNVPPAARPLLDRMRGHGYCGFSMARLSSCHVDDAFLVGDSLGLANPLTGEGILAAALSGKLCGEAILEGAPRSYPDCLLSDPTFRSYRLLHAAESLASRLPGGGGGAFAAGVRGSPLFGRLVVGAFAALFSGRPVPGNALASRVLDTASPRSLAL